jgi:hypothetical protein
MLGRSAASSVAADSKKGSMTIARHRNNRLMGSSVTNSQLIVVRFSLVALIGREQAKQSSNNVARQGVPFPSWFAMALSLLRIGEVVSAFVWRIEYTVRTMRLTNRLHILQAVLDEQFAMR